MPVLMPADDQCEITFVQVIALGHACRLKSDQPSNNDPTDDDENIEASLLS